MNAPDVCIDGLGLSFRRPPPWCVACRCAVWLACFALLFYFGRISRQHQHQQTHTTPPIHPVLRPSSAMSKRSNSEAAAALTASAKKAKAEDGSAAAAAADTSASSGAQHSDKVVHAFHGPLPLLSSGQEKYLPGFGNEHQSEALPHALPIGQNSPQVSVGTHQTQTQARRHRAGQSGTEV